MTTTNQPTCPARYFPKGEEWVMATCGRPAKFLVQSGDKWLPRCGVHARHYRVVEPIGVDKP